MRPIAFAHYLMHGLKKKKNWKDKDAICEKRKMYVLVCMSVVYVCGWGW